MNSDIFPIVDDLTERHKRYLLERHRERLATKPQLKSNIQRLRRLAAVLDPADTARYRNAYMRRGSRFAYLVTIKGLESTDDLVNV